MVKSQFFFLVGIIFLFVCTVKAQKPAMTPEGVIAIKAGHVIDVENGRVLEKQVILLRGKKIEAIGGDLKIQGAARILDFSIKTVWRGRIDGNPLLPEGEDAAGGERTSQLRILWYTVR